MKTKKNIHPETIHTAHDESFDLLAVVGRHVRRPLPQQLASVQEVAREIHDGAGYVADFGAAAPKQESVVALLEAAAAASAEHATLAKQLAAIETRRVNAWNAALAAIEALGERLDAREKLDATVAARWPALGAFAHARRPIAKRAAVSARPKRKANREKAAAEKAAEVAAAAAADAAKKAAKAAAAAAAAKPTA